ncbi:hypothetical protein ACJMK2_038690 [Sinanodonta woodiana]|uniref:CCHC-type domain-containing protein n=2 Tax=Sinanodonta woodiana TaxID=1069815 RepID=A0ABD3VND7_SINWO
MEAHDSTLETIGIQEPQLPPSQRASSTHTILNATPSGEVQFRISNGGEIEKDSQRTASESSSRSTFRNYLPHLQLCDGRDGNRAFSTSSPNETSGHANINRPADPFQYTRSNLNEDRPRSNDLYEFMLPQSRRQPRFVSDRNNHGEPVLPMSYGNLYRRNDSKYHKPATYDGSTHWQDYLVHFELVAEINQWDDHQKALELATSLRGAAQGVLSDLHPDMRRNYRSLVNALASRFEPENQSELYRAQIKSRLRKRGEPLTELAQDIKRLVRLAYPTAPLQVREQLARDCFIDSLNDSELEWVVFQAKSQTVDDALRVGHEYEAFQKGRHGRLTIKHGVRMQREVLNKENNMSMDKDEKSDKKDDMLREILKRIEQLENQNKSNKNPNKNKHNSNMKCAYCGKLGHWESKCFKRLDDEEKLEQNRMTTNTKSQMKYINSNVKVPGNEY